MAEEALSLNRALANVRPDAFTPDLALSLNTLANRLSALGRYEQALDLAEEALTLRRALATARPDAFAEDLSVCLGSLADIRRAAKDLLGAREAFAEAIAVLTPLFVQAPMAVGQWMVMHFERYLDLTEELGLEPDATLLGPVVEIFNRGRK